MGPVSGRGVRSRAVQMLVAAFWLVVACYSTSPGSCRPPCETAGCFNASTSCSYGTYPTCHGCCYRCAAGLGEYCSDNTYHHEPCGTGLVCIGTREDDPLNYPGQCQWRATSTPTTQPTVPASSLATSRTTDTSPSTAPTPTPADQESGDDMAIDCRAKCSPSRCFHQKTGKRICSAAGLAPVVPKRNKCQHTSCSACFILPEPNCSSIHACREPPNKRCLRKFFQCIRNYYSNNTATLVPLDSEAALNTTGRVICHIPEVLSFTGISGSEGAAGSQDDGGGGYQEGGSSNSGGGR